jgi:uncharacterized protein DUF6910
MKNHSISITATVDDTLAAVVVARSALYYADGADPSMDRPAHVRAGSGLAAVPGGIALIQDDANFIAVVRPGDGRARAIPLPAGKGGLRQFDTRRGNKKYKLDLEACVAIDTDAGTLLLALGSGSKRRREQVVLVRGWEAQRPEVTLVHVPRLYDRLRREEAFAGSELNVEGAIYLGDRLRLFGRGNGEVRDGVRPVNATCDLDWPTLLAHLEAPDHNPPPAPANILRYELGTLGGVPLTFTDGAAWGGSVLYSAAAEASPDATRDGRVTGSAIGIIADAGRTRWTPLREHSGAAFVGKVEGVAAAYGAADRVYAVVDADDPDAASVLCTVELRGDWNC